MYKIIYKLPRKYMAKWKTKKIKRLIVNKKKYTLAKIISESKRFCLKGKNRLFNIKNKEKTAKNKSKTKKYMYT